ncbi:MAG: transketolase [Candidatus Omnitrophica bacterium]|nr:transketolase [Candidatus Omnitrophota bacterium]MBU4303666.1 transketolase [Candidatus Omnitrophota bacterium]MBU4467982.1 transketolase [Candidatus Omnitrophota bacterium]MCG2707659.1 transketolase [Candidatus Omnitrophota bacterium]
MKNLDGLIEHAQSVRVNALNMVYRSKASHIGSGYSCVELLVYLYSSWLKVSSDLILDSNRDRFILSKGHAAAVYYAVLAEFGFIPKGWLDKYCQINSPLGGHVDRNVPGVEISTGSLGHGLPIAVGMALAAKRNNKKYRVVALLSDGEMESGANWEAFNMAGAKNLDNLIVIIDRNNMQAMGSTEDILPMKNLDERIRSFGCACFDVNGHDFFAIDSIFQKMPLNCQPAVIIAHTIKGKGVSFMENKLEWHYKSPNDEQFRIAKKELEKR